MRFKDEARWRKYEVDCASDAYSKACVDFARSWADVMEAKMAGGATVAECAKEACSEADKDYGITGFMYGCAVAMLSECWERGEELRRWHNLDTQIKDEGERANESGGVLNPALMTISVPE